jgi:hypothetical protein
MTTDTTPPLPGNRLRRRKEKKSLWQMDVASLGRKEDSGGSAPEQRPPFHRTLPQVDLLPGEVRDAMAVARIRNWTLIALVVVGVVAAGVWWVQGSTIQRAEDSLAAAREQNSLLQAKLKALGPVKAMYNQITTLQQLVTGTLAAQPQASTVIDRLSQAGQGVTGDPIAITSVNVAYTGIPAPGNPVSSCPNPDPFGTSITIGCMTFSATATDRDQVAQLLRLLDDDPLFVGPYVTSTTASESPAGPSGSQTRSSIAFTGSAGVSVEALRTLLTREQIDAILTPPEPEPTPTPSAPVEGEAP